MLLVVVVVLMVEGWEGSGRHRRGSAVAQLGRRLRRRIRQILQILQGGVMVAANPTAGAGAAAAAAGGRAVHRCR
ncbi:hypothetical protein DFJ73DRAFT_880735 [Zopfochytrium polystomum]|nr:hypothetical protein DFJ73DRAFT_880735 [Zopfochytrium polystomum]